MDVNANLLTRRISLGNIYFWVLTLGFLALFGLTWFLSFGVGIPSTARSVVLGAISFVVLLAAGCFLFKKVERLSRLTFTVLLAVLLAIAFGLAFFGAVFLQQDLANNYPLDVGACSLHAIDLAMGAPRPAPWNFYFVSFDTNVFSMMALYFAYSLSMLFTGEVNVLAGSLLNAGFLCCTILATIYIAYLIRGRSGALFMAFLSLFYAPYYFMLSIPYTDSFSLPFAAGGVALYLWALRAKTQMGGQLKLLLCFFVLALGCLMKGNVVVVLLAICIHLLVFYRERRLWQRFVAVAVAFLLVWGCAMGLKAIAQKSLMVDYTEYDTLHIPWTHWVMMGLTDLNSGGFNGESYEYTSSFATVAEKKEGIERKIKEYLAEYRQNFPRFSAWFAAKSRYCWANGDFGAVGLATAVPLHPVDNPHFWPLAKDYMQGLHLAFYFNLFAACLFCLLKRQISTFPLLALSTLLGMFVFLFCWEANPRYAYNISFLLPLGFVWMLPQWQGAMETLYQKFFRGKGKASF